MARPKEAEAMNSGEAVRGAGARRAARPRDEAGQRSAARPKEEQGKGEHRGREWWRGGKLGEAEKKGAAK